MKKPMVSALAILGLTVLVACGSAATAQPTPDIPALYTQAAQTLAVELTGMVPTATFTPLVPLTPTFTVTPLVVNTATPSLTPTQAVCENIEFVQDVNVPDMTVMAPGQDFLKTWLVRNIGTCPWGTGYGLVYGGYTTQMNGQAVPLNIVVNPSETVEVSVRFRAPTQPGEYLSAWRMANPSGVPFGKPIFVKIIVR